MRKTFYFIKILLFFVPLFFISSCKAKLIPSTNVNATRENKEIIAFLEKYKAAIEKRSVDGIMELVAKDFKDNVGSEDPNKELNYLTLKEKLEKYFPRLEDARIGMFVQHIAKIDKDTYEVVFYFNNQFLMEVPSADKWASVKEVNKAIIRRNKNAAQGFEFIKGI